MPVDYTTSPTPLSRAWPNPLALITHTVQVKAASSLHSFCTEQVADPMREQALTPSAPTWKPAPWPKSGLVLRRLDQPARRLHPVDPCQPGLPCRTGSAPLGQCRSCARHRMSQKRACGLPTAARKRGRAYAQASSHQDLEGNQPDQP